MFALLATVALLIVGYVHANIPRFTLAGQKRVIAHAVLLATGVAFGAMSAMLAGTIAPQWAVFVTGVGVVHVPALCVLVIKRLRHSGRS
jgi:hypothetical protein